MSKLYNAIINVVDKFVPSRLRPLWMHPAGPKTVFFWAPMFKWGLVIAGFNDLANRPKELLNARQTGTIALTGMIWSRYSLVVVPKNWNLFSVNLFVAITQGVQFLRAYHYQTIHQNEKKNSE
ncbi:mitochondrial pyruvate carrier 2-like [Episyrphus balteatus]|uniref:mitochondrial pyruvate carrier 2-like n=1 Tax=Episyrphus balteatus TaxID=286459 RepID=UPI002485F39F|nr:mitochondrial pyruvate carrier 2-like [Episyrphus balteatus]